MAEQTIQQQIAAMKELMKSRYAELEEARKPIVAVLQPLRDKLDANMETMSRADERELRAQIVILQDKLAVFDIERGEIAKALVDPDGKARLSVGG